MKIGSKNNNTCMYKYEFKNKNKVHDLRLQVWNLEVSAKYIAVNCVAIISTLALLVHIYA